MRTHFLLVSSLLAATSVFSAETAKKPESGLPTVEQVLASNVKASGGKEALEKIHTRIAKGTMEMTGMNVTATFEFFVKAPNKRASRTEVQGFGVVREGYDGSVGWELNPASGLRVRTGAELARARRDATFNRELHMKELYDKLEVTGRATVGQAEAYVLLATPKEGQPEKYYYDAKSGLLLRQDSTLDTPNGPMDMEVYLEDYRDVDGLKQPFTVRIPKPAELNMVLKFTEIKQNVEIADSEFAKPAQ